MLNWLDVILAGLKKVMADGTPADPVRPNINFVGVTMIDDPDNDATKLTISGAVSDVIGSAPIASSGGAMPVISINPATTSTAGSLSAADKTKLDGFPASSVPTSRQAIAGAGLTGGGDLSTDRTFDVVGNADGSIIANTNDLQVGALGFTRVKTALALANSAIDVNSQQIQGLLDPTQPQHAATKFYVDAGLAALSAKPSVVAISTGNIAALTGLSTTVDGVSFGVDGMRVGLVAQSAAVQNGIYAVHSGAWTRVADMPTGGSASGAIVFAEQGTTNAESGWAITNAAGSDVIGTDSLHWIQFTGLGQVSANGGLVKSGNTISVGANADGSIVVNADDIQVGVIDITQHGVLAGGTAHAVAVAGVSAGFLSAADKTKLNSITSGATIADVLVTAPLTTTGGATPTLDIDDATHVLHGAMSATDKVKIDTMSSGASVSSVSGTAPISVASGTGAAVVSIVASTGSLAGSMSAADKTKLDAAVATAGANTLALRGASGECAFAALTCTTDSASTAFAQGAHPASGGGLRLSNNAGAYERNAADNANLLAHLYDASNVLHIGDPTNGAGTNYDVMTGASHAFLINSVQSLSVGANAVSIGTGTMASAGVVRLAKDTTFKARNAAGSGDISVLAVDGADGIVIGGSTFTASTTRNAKTSGFHAFQINGSESARFDSTQLLLTSPAVNFVTGAGAISFAQAQSASGVGSAWSSYAQQGQAGSIGGIYKIGGGAGGTSGTNLAGATQVDLGTAVSSVSAKCSFLVGGASVLDMNQSAANTTTIQGQNTSLAINLASGVSALTLSGSSATLTCTGGSGVILGAPQFRYQVSNVTALTDIYLSSGACSRSFASTVTSIAYTQADTTVSSATGAATTISAQNATGATANGGALNLVSGTGTTAAGAVVLKAGATTRLTVNATGVGLFATTPVAQPSRAGQITDNSGGVDGSGTVAAITGAVDPTAATKASTANAIATIVARLNLLENKISAAGTGIGVTA